VSPLPLDTFDTALFMVQDPICAIKFVIRIKKKKSKCKKVCRFQKTKKKWPKQKELEKLAVADRLTMCCCC